MFLIGQSIDIHKLEYKVNTLQRLGGIEFILNYELIAHSDGDIILHSISEAILGALGLEDLGYYFSDKNQMNKNLNSLKILDFSLDQMRKRNMEINNVDLMIISEHIHFAEIKSDIKKNLMILLNTNNLSIKATRWEENKMMIQCSAIVTLKSIE
ncbi:MAG: 2-C-methyl-D-erythritol 2,4-cyclodiphosphate synthase [Malacoplasma sp.]